MIPSSDSNSSLASLGVRGLGPPRPPQTLLELPVELLVQEILLAHLCGSDVRALSCVNRKFYRVLRKQEEMWRRLYEMRQNQGLSRPEPCFPGAGTWRDVYLRAIRYETLVRVRSLTSRKEMRIVMSRSSPLYSLKREIRRIQRETDGVCVEDFELVDALTGKELGVAGNDSLPPADLSRLFWVERQRLRAAVAGSGLGSTWLDRDAWRTTISAIPDGTCFYQKFAPIVSSSLSSSSSFYGMRTPLLVAPAPPPAPLISSGTPPPRPFALSPSRPQNRRQFTSTLDNNNTLSSSSSRGTTTTLSVSGEFLRRTIARHCGMREESDDDVEHSFVSRVTVALAPIQRVLWGRPVRAVNEEDDDDDDDPSPRRPRTSDTRGEEDDAGDTELNNNSSHTEEEDDPTLLTELMDVLEYTHAYLGPHAYKAFIDRIGRIRFFSLSNLHPLLQYTIRGGVRQSRPTRAGSDGERDDEVVPTPSERDARIRPPHYDNEGRLRALVMWTRLLVRTVFRYRFVSDVLVRALLTSGFPLAFSRLSFHLFPMVWRSQIRPLLDADFDLIFAFRLTKDVVQVTLQQFAPVIWCSLVAESMRAVLRHFFVRESRFETAFVLTALAAGEVGGRVLTAIPHAFDLGSVHHKKRFSLAWFWWLFSHVGRGDRATTPLFVQYLASAAAWNAFERAAHDPPLAVSLPVYAYTLPLIACAVVLRVRMFLAQSYVSLLLA